MKNAAFKSYRKKDMIIFRTKRIIMISDLNIVILQSDSLPLSVCFSFRRSSNPL